MTIECCNTISDDWHFSVINEYQNVNLLASDAIELPQNNKLTSLVQGNKIIALTLSMNIRVITPWSVNIIALPYNNTMAFMYIYCPNQ